VTSTSEQLLRSLPLFAGLEPAGLSGLVAIRDLEPGEQLWQQGEYGDALYVVETGSLEVASRLPGRRELTLATVGPGDVLGELALLDGGLRTAGVRALEPTRLLRIGRAEFHALVVSRNPCAGLLRTRLTEIACARLLQRHRTLASTLPGTPVPAVPMRGEGSPPPDHDYLIWLPFFHGYRATDLEQLLARGSVERVRRGSVLVSEGECAAALFLTLNGAVEEVIRRHGGSIRVALAGPGRGFGYASLIAGGAATATAIARERSVILAIESADLERQLTGDPFAAAVERDIVGALRQAERPQARLAASAQPQSHDGKAPSSI
jgi:CRP/FNR family transcriptional regulator, cyclic AMP receptor protein